MFGNGFNFLFLVNKALKLVTNVLAITNSKNIL